LTYDPLLMHGDCLELMNDIPDGSIDMVLCDLPYGTTACKWDTVIPFEPLWAHYKRIIKKNGAIVLFGSQPFTSALVMSNPKWFKHVWIWEKSRSGSAISAKYCPVKIHEDVLVFAKATMAYYPIMETGMPYSRKSKYKNENNHAFGISKNVETNNQGTRYPKTIRFEKQNWSKQQQLHPTQKPVALLEYLIKTYTNEGETVLDNCMGSGSTGIACINTGRHFIGIENDLVYFEVAKCRIEKHQFSS
jgi:DNA modification methylase